MIALLLGIALLGFVVYLIVTYIPMPEPFKTGIIVIAVVLVLVYLLQVLGFDIPLPRRG